MREPLLHVGDDISNGGPEGEASVQNIWVLHGEGVAVGVVVPEVVIVVVNQTT